MDIEHAALVVVDVQNGFLNDHSRHVVPTVTRLMDCWSEAGRPVVLARATAGAGESLVRPGHGTRHGGTPRRPPDQRSRRTPVTPTGPARQPALPAAELAPAVLERARLAEARPEGGHLVWERAAYGCLTAPAREQAAREGWSGLLFCGVSTENSVLKSAADASEHGFTPWIVTDACASHGGAALHAAGLTVARRLIGVPRLVTVADVGLRLHRRPERRRNSLRLDSGGRRVRPGTAPAPAR